MKPSAITQNPVLRYIAVLRAARDFGLESDQVDALALRFNPEPGAVDELVDAVADAVLAAR